MTESFEINIKPLFTHRDFDCMKKFGVELGDYAFMSNPAGNDIYPDHANARLVLARLDGSRNPRMPMGGPYWSAPQIKLFQDWIQSGFKA